jgi:hypothetical protein
MLVLLPTLIVLMSTAIFASISFRARKGRDRSAVVVPHGFVGAASSAVNAMRVRMLAAVGAGLVVTGVLAFAPIPALHLSLGATIAPGIGGLVACLSIAAAPFPRASASTGVRQAELTPREATSFGPRWGFVLPLVSAALLVVFLIATASLARETDYTSLSREIGLVNPGGYATASPYPGWFYALPLLVVTVLLSGGVLLALWRIAGARSLGSLGLAPLDAAIRRSTTRFVMLLSSSIIVLYLGATSFTAGTAWRNVAQWSKLNATGLRKVGSAVAPNFEVSLDPSDFARGVVQPQYTTGAIETVVGIVLIGFALTLLILAFASFSVRWTSAETAEPRDREKVSA